MGANGVASRRAQKESRPSLKLGVHILAARLCKAMRDPAAVAQHVAQARALSFLSSGPPFLALSSLSLTPSFLSLFLFSHSSSHLFSHSSHLFSYSSHHADTQTSRPASILS